MKFIRLSFIVLFLASILWLILPHDKLPQISFPKGAQHNTFGELPLVEVIDDGNFYENDGAENGTSWSCSKSCEHAVIDWCESKKFLVDWGIIRKRTKKEKDICVKNAKSVCAPCPPSCEMLKSIGAGWTCQETSGYGGIGWE